MSTGATKRKARRARALEAGREYLTLTIAPHTKARLTALAAAASTSRGVIVDRAIDCLDVCEACKGSGVGEDDRTCRACGGHRVIPS